MTMKLEIIKWNDLTEDEKITSIQRPTLNSLKGQDSTITQIFKDVRADGDEALKKFTSIYDGVKIDDFLMSEKRLSLHLVEYQEISFNRSKMQLKT